MRASVAVVIALALGCLFVVQKQRGHLTASAKTEDKVAENKAATPRPVSEHNWAKHAIDRARSVTDQVAKQRKEDGVRK